MIVSSRRQLIIERRRIGRNIHEARRGKALTLKKLSKILSVKEDLLDRYEIGKNEIRIEMIARIAKSLDVTLKELMLRDEYIDLRKA